jgi:hypothetical protein
MIKLKILPKVLIKIAEFKDGTTVEWPMQEIKRLQTCL